MALKGSEQPRGARGCSRPRKVLAAPLDAVRAALERSARFDASVCRCRLEYLDDLRD